MRPRRPGSRPSRLPPIKSGVAPQGDEYESSKFAADIKWPRAGEILGIREPHVSALMRNRAGNFSVGRLMEFLTTLAQDVRITVKPIRKAQGEMSVVVR